MNKLFYLLIFYVFISASCKQTENQEIRDNFKKYYDKYKVSGSFILYDESNDKYIIYNEPQTHQEFIPASTFKICNSLIGLETGITKDENFIIPWDSIIRPIPAWNSDQDLKSAFHNSTVWYYQELARRVGGKKMKFWLDKANYGNADTTGGIDKFWLTGKLRITPHQQIDFIKRLHHNQLPFSQRTMDITKKIMITDDTLNYIIRAKTGWGQEGNTDIGWYVGYLETQNHVYYFANCVQNTIPKNDDFAPARIRIVYDILKDLKLIPQN